jgi:GNAT superfamily N-acetyltransferase
MVKIIETQDHELISALNEEIQTLHHNLYPEVFKPYNKNNVDAFFKSVVNNEHAVVYLALDNETPVGYALLLRMQASDNPFQYSRNYLLLDQLLVLKDHHYKGIGTLLLETAVEYAQNVGIKTIELNHWTNNESARRFFNKHHFEYFNEKMSRTLK